MEERCDAVVIGAGVAGLRAALLLADAGARVVVVSKDPSDESSSGHAQGGIAVVLTGEEEEIVLHNEDTLRAGAGLCDAPAVDALVRDGREEVLRLIEWGARFDRDGERYHLTREAAHSHPRILHAHGDATGAEIVRALVEQVKKRTGALKRVSGLVTGLLVGDGAVGGVRVLRRDGSSVAIRSAAVLLATGGLGCCWRRTSNPPDATGDGVALAWAAGCVLRDMEFVQFHPTALALPGAPSWLMTEALRGEGGVVRDRDGRRFLLDDDPRGELAPRDVVARGIARRIIAQGGEPVRLDLTGLDPAFVERRFPGIVAACRGWGIDPVTTPLPVAPAAHYAMGGVETDLHGRTNVRGLAAAGEVASTGVHGANRLASNSLLEGLVFGARAARGLFDDGFVGREAPPAEAPAPRFSREADPAAHRARLRDLAEDRLGILRDGAGLRSAVEELEAEASRLGAPGGAPATRAAFEAATEVDVLRAVARGALWREESRGGHFRNDFPQADDARFHVHSLQVAGKDEVESSPVL